MAIETTPLGFKKPDGNESIRNGNDIISDNAQKSQELHAQASARFSLLEAAAGFPADPIAALNEIYVPANPTLTVTYTPDGNVESTLENGILTEFTYNQDGTVDTQTRAGITKTFTYDANGNVTGAA